MRIASLATALLIAVTSSAGAQAPTVDQLQKQLQEERAERQKLEKRLQDLERRSAKPSVGPGPSKGLMVCDDGKTPPFDPPKPDDQVAEPGWAVHVFPFKVRPRDAALRKMEAKTFPITLGMHLDGAPSQTPVAYKFAAGWLPASQDPMRSSSRSTQPQIWSVIAKSQSRARGSLKKRLGWIGLCRKARMMSWWAKPMSPLG